MSSPTYSTDLTLIASAEGTTGDPGTWAEMVGHTGGAAPGQETDYFIQGAACISQGLPGKTGTAAGVQYDYGSDLSGNFRDDTCVFFWQVFLGPNALDTFANGGLRLMVGSTSGNYRFWKSGGNDYGRNPYGGWQNVAIWHQASADYQDGSPTSAARYFGSLPNLLVTVSRGYPHGNDCIRYGRGKMVAVDGDSGSYGTFAGMATQNDSQYNRWGLIQAIPGGYLWKGLMSLGTSANSADFRDENTNILIDDTRRTYASFNRIEVHHPDTRVDWTAVLVSALGSAAPGIFNIVNAPADVNLTSCTFTDMGSFAMASGATISACTLRRCDKLEQNGAILSGCTVEGATTIAGEAFIVSDDPGQISNCDFTYSAGHAMELTAAGSFSFAGNSFTGYGSDETSAAAVYNNSGGHIQLNITDASNPTVRNGAGATTTLKTSVTLTVTVKDKGNNPIENAQVAIYRSDTGGELMNKDTNASGVATEGTSYAGDIYWRVRKSSPGYTRYIATGGTGSSVGGFTLSVTLYEDPNT